MPKFLAAPSIVEEPLVLPIPGADGVVREYSIKEGSAQDLLTLQALDHQVRNGGPRRYKLAADDQARVDAIDSYDDYWGIALGVEVVRAMVADGVSASYFRLASQTASTWRLSSYDEEAALAVWSGKAPTTDPAEGTTDGSTPKEPTGDEEPSTPTEGGSGTPTPTDGSSDQEPQPTPSDTDGATSGTAST